ncbi:hypothetical protein DdX_04451 [Ditylenchus destructor]|uniref:SXP/RAL-2 family protein Ani s 5-like cation-binding domain-containing protein n=1 Tax=Ditylenchus destructor TaxID=166010 RepID=A0AAD4ND33_9BILA|nr:hypothetical protein DdX_04451 [Ditylenchus destructor]
MSADYNPRFSESYGYNKDFMDKLPKNSLESFLAIVRSKSETKAQLKLRFDQWASGQPAEIQALYEEFKKDGEAVEEMGRALADVSNNEAFETLFTPAETEIYAKYLKIITNQDLTQAEECEQLMAILNGLEQKLRIKPGQTEESILVAEVRKQANELQAKPPLMNIGLFKIPPNQSSHSTKWP